MQVSIEISLFPLTEGYLAEVNAFLRLIHAGNLKAVTNGMSTQIFGEFDEVMALLTDALRPFMNGETKFAVSLKMLNDHLPPDRWQPSAWS